jgi:rsbT co-antagonist protein RsbR
VEALLAAITHWRAKIVLLDVTEVAVVDTQVTNTLLQATQAARLLGSSVVLVGVTPEVAQTIVHLGMNLSGLTTRSNMQTGFEYALRTRTHGHCGPTASWPNSR